MDHSPGFLAHVQGKSANVHEVSVADARRAIALEPSARLFDVREDHEWAASHAAGAAHLSRGVLERDIERLVPEKDTPLYLYCGGGFRSALSADALQHMGYTEVHSIAGGWRAWAAAGAPIEQSDPVARIRVTNLDAVVVALRAAGATVEVAANRRDQEVGRGAALRADDGTRVEIWEAGDVDPSEFSGPE